MTTIESEQSREVKLTEIARGPFVLRYLSYRKSEDAALDLRSEDYIVSEINPEKTVFALCDGVGSSFYGNIGSQILGEILLNWLGKVPVPSNSQLEKLTAELTSELNGRTSFATSIIQKKELSSQNEMVRLAESTQRDDFGTQSNFVCGIIWPKSPSLPKGLALLFWLGNARVRLFNQNKDLTSLTGWGKDPDQLLEVWSSKDGVVGRVYSFITDLSTVTSIIAYSDGLENAEEHISPNLDGERLEKLVRHSQSIKDDDATFLELSADNREVPGQADDLAVPLRKHMQTVSSRAPQPQVDPEIQKLRSALDTLQKKYDAQVRKSTPPQRTPSQRTPSKSAPSQGILIAISVIFMVLCLFLGVVIGPKVWSIITPPTKTPIPTLTARPTRTRIPTLTFTETVLPITMPTETFTPTLPTDTATASPTEVTITDTFTPTFTETSTLTLTPSTPNP